ncbi:hypothetical protein GGP41_001569 [Bipolaris sorokiniana]|uniref:Uncharacterized protein n=1 Tax=Cochliobolus sativus TaxID=45130 RepID=A0A8H5ZLR2_COCSA|nr:hypothetical protein GGP41_001569 [Bipolaris sorokiniana]
MKSFIAILTFASCALAAPVAQGKYDGYGDYSGVEVPDVASYGSYPPPAGGYGKYTGYKKQ